MAEPTIAAGFANAFLGFAVARGADRQTLIEQSRLPPQDLTEQDNRIPLATYIELMKAGIELCDEPALALLFGAEVSLSDISILGLVGNAATPEEGCRKLNRYACLAIVGGDWWTERGEAQCERLESSESTRGRVESLCIPICHTGEAKIETIPRKLALSRQTLFRKLKAEGVTFEQVLDELRHKLALEYLNGKNVSVNETAYLLGFSDPAAFSRAFKRWTGASPRTMRLKDL